MYSNPGENRTPSISVLSEQFRRKGYNCREIRDQDATILILTYEKKSHQEQAFPQAKHDHFQNFLRSN